MSGIERKLSLTNSHVHFDETVKDEFSTQNLIAIRQSSPGVFAVHVGFLQIDHKYSISFVLPGDICNASNLEPALAEIPSLNCKMVEFNKVENDYEIKVEFVATTEKLVKEELLLQDKGDGSPLRLVLNARVIGKGKGTPMLRNGVRCIGVTEDLEGEDTDWQGFSHENNP